MLADTTTIELFFLQAKALLINVSVTAFVDQFLTL